MTSQGSLGRVLVLDVGTTRLRASIVDATGAVNTVASGDFAVHRPFAGALEFDAFAMGELARALATTALNEMGEVDGIGITAQRASTIVWDATTGEPIGPGIGWQDLRTTGQCLALQVQGIRLSPNQSATKLSYLVEKFDKNHERTLLFGTIDTYLIWVLSNQHLHVTDRTNAGVTGLLKTDGSDWDEDILEALHLSQSLLPTIVSSSGQIGSAEALPHSPVISGICGDQQASLVGQGCLTRGEAKVTFGTGAMLDCCLGDVRPSFERRGKSGTFPVIAWEEHDAVTWGLEAIMLSAGTCVEWLARLGIIDTPADSSLVAATVSDAGGVVFAPALGGTGTPEWDFGARGALLGLSAATTRAEIVFAVLEGIAQRGADLVDAIESDSGCTIDALKVDGGMSANETFLQLLAATTGKPIAPSSVTEATTRGVGYLAGVATGIWSSLEQAATTATPNTIIEPTRRLDRSRWHELADRSLRTVPALSAITF